MKKKEKKGFVFAAFAAFFNALMAFFAKLAVEVNTETIVFFRNFICLFSVVFFVFGKKDFFKTKHFGLHLFRALFGLLAVYSYYYAIKYLPLVNAIILSNTSSLFIPLVVFVWLAVKIPYRRIFSVILGFIGVIFILNPSWESFYEMTSLIGLFSGFCIAIAMVGVRQLTKTEKTEVIIFYFFFIATLVAFFPMLFSWQTISPQMWLYVLGTGVSGTFFQFFLTKAYTHTPATKASCMLYLSVVFGGVLQYFVFHKIPTTGQFIGCFFIIVGGLFSLLDTKEAIHMSKKPRKF